MEQTVEYYIDRYLQGSITVDELRELSRLMKEPHQKEAFEQMMQESWHSWERSGLKFEDVTERVEATLRSRMGGALRPVHRVYFLRTAWFRYAAAIVLLLGIGGYLLWSNRGEIPARGGNDKGSVVQSQDLSNKKAILTLASGKKIELDNKTPLLVKEGAVFDPREVGQKPGLASYNMITTLKGSQYQLILPDGTKAWLNAASSIKFPTTFTGQTRSVMITGEIYFEVSVNKMAPFVVSSKGMEVQVLGTSFNVKAYEEETTVKTSLVEGAVKVNNQLLNPGQAYLNGKVVATNLDQDIAWKNGFINFEGAGLKEIMNQLQRWYNIEVVYEGGIPDITFFGEMSKNEPLSVMLEALKNMGLQFRIEDERKLVITSE